MQLGLALPEAVRQRYYRLLSCARQAVHYGWLPLIVVLGTAVPLTVGFRSSEHPIPALRLINPLS